MVYHSLTQSFFALCPLTNFLMKHILEANSASEMPCFIKKFDVSQLFWFLYKSTLLREVLFFAQKTVN
jgi:hypothetical protein